MLKRILFLLIIITSISFAQTEVTKERLGKPPKTQYGTVVHPDIKKNPFDNKNYFNCFLSEFKDTLTGKDTVTFSDQKGDGIFQGVWIRNGGADNDTANVFVQDPWGNWTYQSIGLIDADNGDYVVTGATSKSVVIENGKTKYYRLNKPFWCAHQNNGSWTGGR